MKGVITTSTKASELLTSVTYTANGTQKVFSIPFDYLRGSFIHVNVNNEAVSDFEVINRTLEFAAAPAAGATIYIYRETPTERLVSWADASVLKASDMTISQVQQLHIIEEGQDWSKANSIVLNDTGDAWEGRGHRMANLADPINPADAVTKDYMETVQGGFVQQNTAIKNEATRQANIATQQATNAKNSATAAKNSENASAASENMSERWAQASDSPDGVAGNKSSKTWATESKNSAAAALASQNAAKTSETNAKASENAAKASQTAAKTSETNAKASENAAKASQTAAKTSETNAANSATMATNKANEATTQANKAKTEADRASGYATALEQLGGIEGVANQAEAEAGTNNTKVTTPLRVAQYVANYFKNFLLAAVFTGIAKGVAPDANSNDSSIPTTSWVRNLLTSTVMSLVVTDYLLEQNGYVKFRFGLILQWGYHKAGSISFNLPYTKKIFTVVKSQTSTDEGHERRVTSITLTTFTAYKNVNEYYYWLSMGV